MRSTPCVLLFTKGSQSPKINEMMALCHKRVHSLRAQSRSLCLGSQRTLSQTCLCAVPWASALSLGEGMNIPSSQGAGQLPSNSKMPYSTCWAAQDWLLIWCKDIRKLLEKILWKDTLLQKGYYAGLERDSCSLPANYKTATIYRVPFIPVVHYSENNSITDQWETTFTHKTDIA